MKLKVLQKELENLTSSKRIQSHNLNLFLEKKFNKPLDKTKLE